jgi:hypothetical protein
MRASEKGAPEPRLRLVKVLVQPVLILDEGDNVREVTAGVVEVMAADWPTWSAETFSEGGLVALRDQLLASEGGGE